MNETDLVLENFPGRIWRNIVCFRLLQKVESFVDESMNRVIQRIQWAQSVLFAKFAECPKETFPAAVLSQLKSAD